MTKKLLICMSVLCMLSFYTKASDIVGTYVGDLTVTAIGETNIIPNTNIIVNKEEVTGNYTLSIKDFYFGELLIGDLEVNGLTRTEDGGIIVLSKSGYSEGPEIGIVQTYIYLVDDIITIDNTGELELSLVVKAEPDINSDSIAEVLFTGNKQSSGLTNPKNNPTAIYVSSDFNTISTLNQSGNYVIFSTTGATIQSGNIENGTISISDLKAGIYLVKINNNIAKFVKK